MAKNRSHVNRKASSSSVLTSNISQLEPRGFGLPEGNEASAQSSGLDLSTVPMTATGMPVQAKLTVGQPGDKYEQEADAVAAQVVDRINSPQPHHSQPGTVQRQEIPEEEEEIQQKPLGESIQRQEIPEEEEEIQAKPLAESIQRQEMLEEEEEMLQQKPLAESIQRQEMPEEEEELAQMKPELQREELVPEEEEESLQKKTLIQAKASGGAAASQSVEATISGARGQGQPLSDETRGQMEGAFGADFGGVRVHTDGRSDQLNQSLQARAFTTGQDIFFKRGEFNPRSKGGQELLAHELTHVMQQAGTLQRFCDPSMMSCLPEEDTAGITSAEAPMSISSTSTSYFNSSSELVSGSQSQPTRPKPKPTTAPAIDSAKVKSAANAIFKAVDGWGTDEDAIMKALAGKTPAEIAAIEKEYSDHYNGRSLRQDIQDELSGDDLAEAKAHLSGDKATAAVAALSNSIGYVNDDEQKIEDTLASLSPEELKEMQEMAAEDPAIKAKLDTVLSYLDGKDKEVTQALLEGNKDKATALRIVEAIEGVGTDEDTVYKHLEGKSSQELEAIQEAYLARTGRTLITDIDEDFSSAEKDRAKALVAGDSAGAIAAQIQDAAEGIGTDEQVIYDQLKGKSQKERQTIIEAYDRKYGSFDAMIKDEFWEDENELRQAQQYRNQGELDPGFALKLGIEGLGTDEKRIREVLENKTANEIKTIREAYRKETGRDLDFDLTGEIDGRDAFEIGQMLKGKPQNATEEYQRAMDRYEFERGQWSTGFSRVVMDSAEFLGMHSKGEMLEYQTQRLRSMFDKNGQLKSGFTEEDAKKIADYQKTDSTNYKEAKESVGNAVSTGGTIAVAALVTVCTKGAASPWLVAAISGAAGGLTNMAIKQGMHGSAYGGEDIAIDALTTALTSAIGGSMADKTAFMQKLEDITSALGETMARKVAIEAIRGSVGGASNESLKAMMNDHNWRQGVADYLTGIGGGILKGSAVGGVTSAASAGIKEGLNGKASSVVTDASGAVVETAVTEGINAASKDNYQVRLEDVLGRFLAAGSVAATKSKVTSWAGKARMDIIAGRIVDAGDNMPKVEQIIQDQTKHLNPEEKSYLRMKVLEVALNQGPQVTQGQGEIP